MISTWFFAQAFTAWVSRIKNSYEVGLEVFVENERV
jgi:hypothetical protein